MIEPDELALAERIARNTATRWPAVEFDDCNQHLRLWMVLNNRWLVKYREGGRGKLVVALNREAHKFAVHTQRERSGQPVEPDAPYSLNQIERALPFIFEDIPQPQSVEINGQLYATDASEPGLAQAAILDLRASFEHLPASSREVLTLRFCEGLKPREISARLGCTRQAVEYRVKKAIRQMRDALA